MKNTLFILLLLPASNHLFACMSATQNRLFPLGQSSKGLCAVETQLYRTESKENGMVEMKPAWGGISYFKIYDRNYREVYSEVIDTLRLFKQQHYDSIIAGTFKKGLVLAKTHPDFVAAKPMAITFCDYRETCSKAELLFDTVKNKISIKLPGKIKYELKVLDDSASIASNLLDYFGGFDDANLSAKFFMGNLYINSVRQFQIGGKKLTIVHIGCGQISELSEGKTYPPGKEYKPKFAFTDLENSVFVEPVLHHGHGFDYFIWE